jgi:NAD(P)-dependent dehydrogenase (short-subunit alcohol dehydrogenase family)
MLHENRVAIVTGAAQGIGRACAERLAKEGARVVLADTNAKEAKSVAEAITKAGGVAASWACDVGVKRDVDSLIGAAMVAFGSIDLLINNAGVVDDAPFLELAEAEFDRIVRTNLKGAFLVGQAVARQMALQVKSDPHRLPGAIVNMSSINAWFGLPDHVAYSVSKGGIMQLTKAMAVSLAPLGIRVNAVGPGTIETPLIKDVVKDKAFRSKVLSRTPLGRFGKAEEIAAVVAWLLSEEASYLTGTTVYADGGRMPLNYVMPLDGAGEE